MQDLKIKDAGLEILKIKTSRGVLRLCGSERHAPLEDRIPMKLVI